VTAKLRVTEVISLLVLPALPPASIPDSMKVELAVATAAQPLRHCLARDSRLHVPGCGFRDFDCSRLCVGTLAVAEFLILPGWAGSTDNRVVWSGCPIGDMIELD
jgi:hypothetical protein